MIWLKCFEMAEETTQSKRGMLNDVKRAQEVYNARDHS